MHFCSSGTLGASRARNPATHPATWRLASARTLLLRSAHVLLPVSAAAFEEEAVLAAREQRAAEAQVQSRARAGPCGWARPHASRHACPATLQLPCQRLPTVAPAAPSTLSRCAARALVCGMRQLLVSLTCRRAPQAEALRRRLADAGLSLDGEGGSGGHAAAAAAAAAAAELEVLRGECAHHRRAAEAAKQVRGAAWGCTVCQEQALGCVDRACGCAVRMGPQAADASAATAASLAAEVEALRRSAEARQVRL
jgi:hypothetical protein